MLNEFKELVIKFWAAATVIFVFIFIIISHLASQLHFYFSRSYDIGGIKDSDPYNSSHTIQIFKGISRKAVEVA